MSELREDAGLERDAAAPYRFGIVVSRTNSAITGRLLQGASETLRDHGARFGAIRVVEVPGAFELPMAAGQLAGSRVDAILCLGALIRGETPHFDVLAASVAHAIQDVARQSGTPTIFGVLTADTWEQAEARAGGDKGNKGSEAALAAIEMAVTFAALE